MAEYIEVDQMWKCETCFHNWNGCTLGIFGCDHGESYRPAYDKLKKADVAPVVHGKWVFDFNLDGSNFYWCSICNRQEVLLEKEDIYEWCPYCHCGARMDGDKDAH